MEWGWLKQWIRRFKVPVKVSQARWLTPRHWISSAVIKSGGMNEDECEWLREWEWDEWRARSETGISVLQMQQTKGGYEWWKRYSFKTRVKLRWRKSKTEVGTMLEWVEEEVWHISTGRLFHKIGAWWKKDLLVTFIRDVTVGRRKVTTEEERVILLVWTARRE